LYFGAIGDGQTFVRRALCSSMTRMLELGEYVVDVSRDAESAAPVVVVPLDGDASKFVAGHVELDAMVFLEEIDEEVKMLNAHIFNAKIVDYEAELKGMPFVAPEARCRCCFVKAFGNQTGAE
jgi:hypothetical protein